MEFIDAIRKRRSDIIFPTQRKFSIESWKAHKKKYEFSESSSSELFDAGLFFFEVLENLRGKLREIDSKKPIGITQADMRRYLCGLSNRHRKVLGQKIDGQVKELINESGGDTFYGDQLHNLTGASLVGGGVLSIEDSSHQVVDNFAYVMRSLHFPSKKLTKEVKKSVKIDEREKILKYVAAHEQLSTLYGIYEDYWNCLVSEEVGFRDEAGCVRLYPKCDEINLAKTASFHRRTRHVLQRQQVLLSIIYQKGSANSGNLILEKGAGRNSKYVSLSLEKQEDQFKFESLRWEVEKEIVNEALSKTLCDSKKNSFSICVNEIIDYFIIIKLFAIDKFNKLPENTAIFKPGTFHNFSVEIDYQKFCKALSVHFNHTIEKSKNIFEFLTFSKDRNKDLWANPLIQRTERKVMLLLTPFMEASLLRNSEIWAMQLGLDSAEKGSGYEDFVRDRFESCLKENDLLKKSEISRKAKFKISGEEEEIDVVIRVGNLLVIGEVKSIITVDGPSAFRNSKHRIFEALSQIDRKRKFVERNISEFLKRTGWSDIDPEEASVQPIVLVSNYTFAGFNIGGVPILDELLLSAYCRYPIIPIFSETGKHGTIHRFGVQLYIDEWEAEANFLKYAMNPPQLQTIKSGLHCVEYEALVPNEIGKNLKFGRLEVCENQDINSIVKMDTGFDLVSNPVIEGF